MRKKRKAVSGMPQLNCAELCCFTLCTFGSGYNPLHKPLGNNVGQELNIGGSIVVAALKEVSGANKTRIRDLYNCLGDLGMTNEEFRTLGYNGCLLSINSALNIVF